MEYSPAILASLTVQAIILGGALGVLYSVLELIRLIFGEERCSIPKFLSIRLPTLLQFDSVVAEKKSRVRSGCLFLLRFFEDIFFCLSVIIGIILLAYVGNNGRIRWFILFGVFIGFVTYMGSLGVLFFRISSGLAALIRWGTRTIFHVMMLPLNMTIRGIKSFFGFCKRAFKSHILERKNEKYHIAEMRRILESASNGFGCITNFDLPNQALLNRSIQGSTLKTKDVKKKGRRSVYGRTSKSEDTEQRSPKVSTKT